MRSNIPLMAVLMLLFGLTSANAQPKLGDLPQTKLGDLLQTRLTQLDDDCEFSDPLFAQPCPASSPSPRQTPV